jgi:osmoprotectant transport system ATP-binding protein
MIKLKDVSKSYDGGVSFAVKDVTFEVGGGETVVLLGSSGCGKTTLLKMMNRLIEPTSGEIHIGGTNVLEQDPIEVRRSLGYVIQGIGLFPHMTIEENVSVVPGLLGWGQEKQKKRADEILTTVGLAPDEFAHRYPDELSGGQQQRVGVARALAAGPEVLLMDEPFGAIDALTRELLQQELIALKERLEKTIVFVTHDIFEAFTLADRIAVLHEGTLQQIGTKDEILNSPQTEFVRNLLAAPRKQLDAFRGAL